MFKNFAFTLVLAILVIACSNKKRPSLSGDEPVEVADFISSFELVNTTYEINDRIWAGIDNGRQFFRCC